MAVRSNHVTTRSAQYSLGAGADLPIARIVVLLLLALPIAALIVASHMAKAAPSEGAIELANFNPKALFADTTPHFLPKPVAALEPDADAGPPAPAEAEQAPSDTAEQVKVANTGGVGAILRADPPRGRQVTGLRD